MILDLEVGESLGLKLRDANDTGGDRGHIVVDLLLRKVDLRARDVTEFQLDVLHIAQ